jgi:hypothetical protein
MGAGGALQLAVMVHWPETPPIGTPGDVPHGGNSTPSGAPVDEPVKSERSSEQASFTEWIYSFFCVLMTFLCVVELQFFAFLVC